MSKFVILNAINKDESLSKTRVNLEQVVYYRKFNAADDKNQNHTAMFLNDKMVVVTESPEDIDKLTGL